MTDFIPLNIKYIKEKVFNSSDAMGEYFGYKKGNIGNYINGKSLAPYLLISKICNEYNISKDVFFDKDLSKQINPLNSKKETLLRIKGDRNKIIDKIAINNNTVTLDQIAILITTNRSDFYKNRLFATFLDLHKERAIRQYLELSSK